MVLLPTVFIPASERNTYLLLKNCFNLYHLVCMTESLRDVSVYAESLQWLWIHFLFSALKALRVFQSTCASLACHNHFRSKIPVTVCKGRKICIRTFWAAINKSTEANNVWDQPAIGAAIAMCWESHCTEHPPPQQDPAAHSWSDIAFSLTAAWVTASWFSIPWNKFSCTSVT